MTESGLKISISRAEGMKFLLPLIGGKIKVTDGKIDSKKEIFFLTGGFIAQEYSVLPDLSGNIEFLIEA